MKNIFYSKKPETKKKNGDVFALLFASSSNKESVNVVTSFQAQAEYLEAIDKFIMDSVYNKVKAGTATNFEKGALEKYYYIVILI